VAKSHGPESQLLERFRDFEADTSHFISHRLQVLASLGRQRNVCAAFETLNELTERVVGGNSARAARQFTVERQDRVPGAVGGQVPTQADEAIGDGVVGSAEPEEPSLGVECALPVGCVGLDYHRLKVAIEHMSPRRGRNVTGVTEYSRAAGASTQGMHKCNRIARQGTLVVLPVEHGKAQGDREQGL
jgi:hypothetical protein